MGIKYIFNPITGSLDAVSVGTPAGATTQVQFNDAGAFGGDSGLTFNKTTDALSAGGFIPTSSTVPANGIYLPAANRVGVATNGTGRLFVDANGFVGIGAVNTGSTGAQLSTTTTSSTARLIVESTNAAGYTGLRVANGTGHWEMQVDGANQGLRWLDDGSERLRITSAGLVGIGTSAPTALLEVFATINSELRLNTSADGYLQIGQFANGASIGTSSADATAGALRFVTAGSEKARFDTSGRLGIGTTSPVQALDVVGSINLTGNHTFSTTTSPLIAATAASSVLRFGTGSGGTERARIDDSGRLLVGTSSSITAPDAVGTNRDSSLQLAGNLLATTMQGNHFFNSSGTGPLYQFTKSNTTTIGSHTIVALNNRLGTFQWSGSDGTNYIPAAQIKAEVDGTPGANNMPGRIVLSTTASGASSPTERMRITSAGLVGIGSSAPGASGEGAGLRVHSYLQRTEYYSPAGYYAGSFGYTNNTQDRVWLAVDSNYSQGSAVSAGIFLSSFHQDTGGSHCGYTIKDLRADGALVFSRVTTAASLGTAATETERARIDSSGNVGIGTTSPAQLLHLNSASANATQWIAAGVGYTSNLSLLANGSGGGLLLSSATDSSASIINSLNAALTFGTNNTERFRCDSSGRLLVGTSTSAGVDAILQTRSDSFGALNQENFYSAANSSPPNLIFAKSRGSAAAPAVVNADDFLGIIRFRGHDGTDYDTSAAEIYVQVDGTPGANDMPGRLVFSTTADGAASPTERLRITSAGVLQVADAGDITVGTTTGTKIGTATTQKLGFWDKTPVVQPTTGISGATFDLDTGLSIRTNSTFDGYTVAQVVAALRQLGILA
jgi:hypothetical protein